MIQQQLLINQKPLPTQDYNISVSGTYVEGVAKINTCTCIQHNLLVMSDKAKAITEVNRV